MAWATPPTFTAHTTLGASSLQTLSDNESYLLSGFSASKLYDKGSDITTTSTTFVAVDSTNLARTVTINGTKALIIFRGVFSSGTSIRHIDLDVNVNGTRWASTGADGSSTVQATTNTIAYPGSVVMVVDGLTPGSNTFQAMWKTSSAATLTLYAGAGAGGTDFIPAFDVWGA